MLHKCSVCGLPIPSSGFVIFPATLSRPPYTYISLCPSPCWPCLCIVCRVVRVACAVCADVGEHVCVYVSLGPEEKTQHTTNTPRHLALQAHASVFNWPPSVLCCCAHREDLRLPSVIFVGCSLRVFCAASVPFCIFRHRDSSPGRSGEGRVSWPARL